MPLRYICLGSIDGIATGNGSDHFGKSAIIADTVVIPVGELGGTKHMGNDIFQRCVIPGIKNRVQRHSRDERG